MVGNSSRSKPVSTSSGLQISTSIPRSTWPATQSSRFDASTLVGPIYFSLDLDGLDPAFAPGVSHHEPGGLTVREVLDLIDALPGPIVGADVVELNPSMDLVGMTAMVGAKFVKELAGRMLTVG